MTNKMYLAGIAHPHSQMTIQGFGELFVAQLSIFGHQNKNPWIRVALL
jgi:hypothetical protein